MTATQNAHGPSGYVQIPRSLLYSSTHSGLAVWAWAMYETLMPHGIAGGRDPAIARRRFLAERAGASTTALDDARRQLLAPAAGGPYLSRSSPRGAKRSVLHAALRLPRETGEPFAAVPAWTLALVGAGRRRPGGSVSPEAWRLYAAAVDRAGRTGDVATFETTVGRLGAVLQASPATGRRRLVELEAAGLIEVAQRLGGWLSVRVVQDPKDVTETAGQYARQGRRHTNPRRDPCRTPSQVVAHTPTKIGQAPVADPGTPQESPPTKPSPEESLGLPAVGEDSDQACGRPSARGREAPTTTRQRSAPRRARSRRPVARAAAGLYRCLPVDLTERIGEHGSRRVLAALNAELEHRSPDEMAERIARNWAHWRTRLLAGQQVRDPVAVTIRLARRGLCCPDVRCEDGWQLDLDGPCKACAQIASERAARSPGHRASEDLASYQARLPGTRVTGLGDGSGAPPIETVKAVDSREYATLARQLLRAHSDGERDAIEATWRAARTSCIAPARSQQQSKMIYRGPTPKV